MYSSGQLCVQEFIPFDTAVGTYAIRHQNYGVATDWDFLASNAVKSIGATTAPPSYPFRCQIRSFGRMGVCSYYGKWTSSAGDPVILHIDCALATKVDFSAAGSDGKAYPGYAYENGDVHLFANTSGSDINVFFSFTFIIV